MARASAVSHPSQWPVSGYNEIQFPPHRFRIIDRAVLVKLLQLPDEHALPLSKKANKHG